MIAHIYFIITLSPEAARYSSMLSRLGQGSSVNPVFDSSRFANHSKPPFVYFSSRILSCVSAIGLLLLCYISEC
jgi:hypothetical protein